jgi:hypothetical protein
MSARNNELDAAIPQCGHEETRVTLYGCMREKIPSQIVELCPFCRDFDVGCPYCFLLHNGNRLASSAKASRVPQPLGMCRSAHKRTDGQCPHISGSISTSCQGAQLDVDQPSGAASRRPPWRPGICRRISRPSIAATVRDAQLRQVHAGLRHHVEQPGASVGMAERREELACWQLLPTVSVVKSSWPMASNNPRRGGVQTS